MFCVWLYVCSFSEVLFLLCISGLQPTPPYFDGGGFLSCIVRRRRTFGSHTTVSDIPLPIPATTTTTIATTTTITTTTTAITTTTTTTTTTTPTTATTTPTTPTTTTTTTITMSYSIYLIQSTRRLMFPTDA
eukprot:NODE_311_length_1493_cov_1385.811634_g224_i0.p1 GENE.NODE_311_length_1493_cov_1385.811634_g224_i0~~NODE_311_length_1493_cov_1385.811634_g224_i0.p1  ORF type:complete len:132 (-),score=63.82 NODE_311_length_1493_cov_1385.811634_g224_i0:3-398(-)